MLRFGYITNYDECGRVVVQIQDEDNFTTDYIPVLKTNASLDETGDTIDTTTLVAVLLDDMNPMLGICLGKIQTAPRESVNKRYAKFVDGSSTEYDRETHSFSANVLEQINITAKETNLNSILNVSENIVGAQDVSDKKGTMQAIRDFLNSHTHSNGNEGKPTGVPTSKI